MGGRGDRGSGRFKGNDWWVIRWIMGVDVKTGVEVKPELEFVELSGLMLGPIRNYEKGTLVRKLADRFDEGCVPALEEAKDLLCRWLSDSPSSSHRVQGIELPWSRGLMDEVGEISDGETGEVAESIRLKKKVNELEVTRALLSTMGPIDKSKLCLYYLENRDVFNYYAAASGVAFSDVLDLTFDLLDERDSESDSVGDALADYYQKAVEERGPILSVVDWYFFCGDGLKLGSGVVRNLMLWSLVRNGEVLAAEKVLASLAVLYQLPSVLNVLRTMMGESKEGAAFRENAAEMLKHMMNLSSGVVAHANLESVYGAAEFARYLVSEQTRPIRRIFFKEWKEELAVGENDKVLDVATGTGWLVGLLKNDSGYRNVVGVDISETNLRVAVEDEGGSFAQASWEQLPFADGEFKLITCLGRSLPHVEDESGFRKAVGEMVRVMREDGVLVFDMPNPEKGEYADNLRQYRELMQRFGYPHNELSRFYYVVDSPNGKDFYNRFVPPKERVLKIIENMGMGVEVVEEGIPGGKGDENLVFVCRRKLGDGIPGQVEPASESGGDGRMIDNDAE